MLKMNSTFIKNELKVVKTAFSKKIKKIFVIILVISASIIIVSLLFISFIAKWLVEKYDVKYLGREVTMDWIYVNPFTGYANMSNLKIYEFESDSVFISANSLSVNFSMLKLFLKTIEISEITLDRPKIVIIQNKSVLNFGDIIERFKPKHSANTNKAPTWFNIVNIKVVDGEFRYRELVTPINYFITNVSIDSPGKLWNTDTIVANFTFLSGIGSGGMSGKIKMNIKSLEYKLAIIVDNFRLNILEQYLNDLTNYGTYSAILDADLSVVGNFKTARDVSFSGFVSLSDFQIGKNAQDKYASFDKFSFSIFELSPNNHKYLFDSISLVNPYFKYERYDHTDNLHSMFGNVAAKNQSTKASTDKFNLLLTIGAYIVDLSKNFFKSDYQINSLQIDSGNLQFNDFSIPEKFSIDLSKINISADSINKINKRVNLKFDSQIEPYGSVNIEISVNPKDSSDFDVNYQITQVPLSIFNPYLISYTSYPFDRGTLEIRGNWNVRKSEINSVNHLVVIDPRVSERIKNVDSHWLPIPLIIALVRERGNVIDYQIPIKGDLKNPKFKFKDVISDLLENIFVKPPSTPYIYIVKNAEEIIEKSLSLKWQMRNNTLLGRQEKFIKTIVDFLVENPEAKILVRPQFYYNKEKEYILFFEAKKMFLIANNSIKNMVFSPKDSLMVDKFSVKDSMFIRYVDKMTHDKLLFSMQDKCSSFIKKSLINSELKKLENSRKALFVSFFKDKDVDKQLTFSASKNVVPFNGFSFYKIEYKNDFPESLINAYNKMNDLNHKKPRKRYFKKRVKNE